MLRLNRHWIVVLIGVVSFLFPGVMASGADSADYWPAPESRGGWRRLAPAKGTPSEAQKAEIREKTGINWNLLAGAWLYNAEAEGATGLIVIRKGYVVGEWYRGCDHTKPFNIYSSSKAYTSTAFGMLLGDSAGGKLAGGKKLSLDTKVCTKEWLPDALPLSDPRKANITLKHLLTMTSGVGSDRLPPNAPFAGSMGHVEGSPLVKLKGEPGTVFNYSDANILHLVLLFRNVAGIDLLPYLKQRLLDPIGMEKVTWVQIGDKGGVGPLSQGYSGLHTTARDHARFCYLALHRGRWGDKTIVPAEYYDWAWKGTKAKPDYAALWWVYPRHPDAPKDLVQSAGALNNHGYIVPSLDLIFVRLGNGNKYPKDFEHHLVNKVIAAIEK